MASYFELPLQQNDEAATIGQVPEEERKQLGRMSLMSPAVTQLLEDLGNEDSDSSGEDNSLSEGEDAIGPNKGKSEPSGPSRQDEKRQNQDPERKPSALSPSRSPAKPAEGKGTSHVKSPSVRAGGVNSSKKKPAHMARFHSLRSMLFQANIEDKMKSTTKEDCRKQEEAANQWKSQHDQRQMHRPKTPEKEQQEKEGLGSRLKTKIRRMTSKEVPTLQNIGEDDAAVGKFDDRASTASSDADEGVQRNTWQNEISDSESINHSDVEELVRWVSRRDPPSDGEARKNGVVRHEIVDDSGHESLGHSDVEDLVRWVSHRSDAKEISNQYTGYSDASTESDSEVARHSSDEEDADDLVRWISRRDGPKAGPVRRKLTKEDLDSDVERHYDSDVPELGRWFQRHDDTSGESAASSPVRGERPVFDDDEEEQRGRPRSRESHSPNKLTRNHLTHEDVDELVRWVSRKDSKQQEQSALENDDRVLEWKRQEDEKKKQLGMTVDEGSLSHSDVKELIEHVRTNSFQAVQGSNISAEAETGDLRALRAGRDEVQVIRQDEEKKKQQLGMTVDEGSLSHSDVQDLIEHVRKDSSSPQNDLYSMNTKEKDAAEFASKEHSQPSRGESKQIDSKDFSVDKTDDRIHRDSLGEEDVDELVKWVSAKH